MELSLHPLLHTPLGEIPSYTLFMALGFFIAAGISIWRGHKLGIGFDAALSLMIVACIAALVGARAWYVATHFSAYRPWFQAFPSGGMNIAAGSCVAAVVAFLVFLYARSVFRLLGAGPGTLVALSLFAITALFAGRVVSLHTRVSIDPFAPGDGGLAFFGGFALAVPACVLTASRRGIPVVPGADAVAPGILAGSAVGRIGCFLNGCCFGRPANGFLCPGGRIPTQLIEAAFTASIAAIFLFVAPEPRAGRTAAAAILSYCFARFSLEFLRDDTTPAFAGLTANQVASLAVAFPALWLALRSPAVSRSPHA